MANHRFWRTTGETIRVLPVRNRREAPRQNPGLRSVRPLVSRPLVSGGTVSNPIAELNIKKYAGYISIKGDIGGKIDANGKLIPGTYTPCK